MWLNWAKNIVMASYVLRKEWCSGRFSKQRLLEDKLPQIYCSETSNVCKIGKFKGSLIITCLNPPKKGDFSWGYLRLISTSLWLVLIARWKFLAFFARTYVRAKNENSAHKQWGSEIRIKAEFCFWNTIVWVLILQTQTIDWKRLRFSKHFLLKSVLKIYENCKKWC